MIRDTPRAGRKSKAEVLFELLKNVHSLYLQPAAITHCLLMTDHGHENFGRVQDFLACAENPTLQRIVAQHDIEFSNLMIEAANKNIKYRFLYHKNIADYNDLCKYLPLAIDDFNNRPHDILAGFTPLEVLKENTIDRNAACKERLLAKATRIKENKKATCCAYSF